MEIGKLAAAERLIVSGIAMIERCEDKVATHVVAASALAILRDLLGQDGSSLQERVFREGLFIAAEMRNAGEDVDLGGGAKLKLLIERLALAIRSGAAASPSDLVVELPKAERGRMLQHVFAPFNFLKHADRDALATISEADLDPETALQHALTAYSMIEPDKEWPAEVGPFLERIGALRET